MKILIRLVLVGALIALMLAYRPLQHAHGKLGQIGQILTHPANVLGLCLVFAVLMVLTFARRSQPQQQRPAHADAYAQAPRRRFARTGRN